MAKFPLMFDPKIGETGSESFKEEVIE